MPPNESEYQHHDPIEEVLQRVLASQRPFYNSLLNQMQAVEKRLHAVDTRGAELALSVERLAGAQLTTQINAIEIRLAALEAEQHKRQGMKELFDWVPKILVWVGLGVAAVVGYWHIKGGK